MCVHTRVGVGSGVRVVGRKAKSLTKGAPVDPANALASTSFRTSILAPNSLRRGYRTRIRARDRSNGVRDPVNARTLTIQEGDGPGHENERLHIEYRHNRNEQGKRLTSVYSGHDKARVRVETRA